MTNTNKIKILQLNIRGMKKRLLDRQTLITEKSPHIITLNETFLNGSQTITLNGYETIIFNRPTHGCGVAMLIKSTIDYDEVMKIHINQHEIIQCRVQINEKDHIYLTSIYARPQTKIYLDIFTALNKESSILLNITFNNKIKETNDINFTISKTSLIINITI